MAEERRFPTEFRETETAEPGLVLTDGGEVEVIRPGGAREVVGGANGGSQPVTNGAMVGFIQYTDNVEQSWSGDIAFGVVYDTDGFCDPSADPVYADRLVIPAGLEGLYLMEAVMYAPTEGDTVDSVSFILDDPSNSCDFTADAPSGLGGLLVGGDAFVRPLQVGDSVSLALQYVNGLYNPGKIQGSSWATDPDNPSGPGLFDFDATGSTMTVTRLGPLPEGFTGY